MAQQAAVAESPEVARVAAVMERLQAQLLALVARGDFRGSLTINVGPRITAEIRATTGVEQEYDFGLV